MTYSLILDYVTGVASTQFIRRDADNVFIPHDPENADWRAYQEWVAQGNLPTGAAPIAASPPPLGFLAFMALFSAAEQAALVNSGDTQVKLFLLQASGAGEIDLANTRTRAALDYLTASGLLAIGRAGQILVGAAPQG